jgi:hypothetical protein
MVDAFAKNNGRAGRIYFAVATYLEKTYVPPPSPTDGQVWLPRPLGSDTAFVSTFELLDGCADNNDQPFRSPVIVYENGKPLGPAHTMIDGISKAAFSHWQTIGIIFSDSDDHNPNINRKRYTVLPVKPRMSVAMIHVS